MASETYVESANKPMDVVVHPIVLLSVVDHYNRVAKGTSKRVVGTLLGEVRDTKLHVTSSFAVPFEEETRDPQVWFVDHNYHENLAAMFKKVNAKEKIVGPKIKPNDIQIHELYRNYIAEPVFVILDVAPKEHDFPLEAYYAVQSKTFESQFNRTFRSVPSSFGADEAEEVGTEHLLRDLRNVSTSTLATKVQDKCRAQKTLISKLKEILDYLQLVSEGKYPYNSAIVSKLQDIFNELPEMSSSQEMVKACAEETNDHFLGIYVGAMLRSILALHELVKNKIKNKEFREAEEQKEIEDAEKKEKEAAAKKEKEAAEKKKKEEKK